MEEEQEISIVHPLTAMQWEECAQLPQAMYDAQCVVLNNMIYVGGGDTRSEYDTSLFMTPVDPIAWTTSTTPTRFYALCTYHCQLVLIGGIEVSTRQVTNKLWASGTGTSWERFLPPMLTKRYSSSAVNTVSPEYLVVAGGGGDNLSDADTVEVLIGQEWWTVEPLPKKLSDMKSTLHNGILYFMGGVSQAKEVYFCHVKSLAKFRSHSSSDNDPLWKRMNVISPRSSCTSFGKHLLSIGGGGGRVYFSDICANSPLTQAWVRVGEVPIALCDAVSVVIPAAKKLVVLGGRSKRGCSARVFRAALKASPYDPSSSFSMSSLFKLEEGAGIKVVSSLAKIPARLAAAVGINLQEHVMDLPDKNKRVEMIIDQWKAGDSQRPATWRSLLNVLQDLGLEDLSQEVEDYMHGVQSLQLLCSEVIKSALQLEERSLEPDKLATELPSYVPMRIKHQIIHYFVKPAQATCP